jgi:beta-N-acetylhexosaminidase
VGLGVLAIVAAASFAAGALGGSSGGGGSDPAGGGDEPFALRPLPELSAAQLAGQRLVAGFEGRHPPQGLEREIRAGRLAGVVLFADHAGSAGRTRRVVRRLQRIPRPPGLRAPLLVMVDQEGGLVKRISGPPDASAEEMGRRGRAYSFEQGRRTGELLRGSGVSVDLAPVLDVRRRGSAIGAEQRSFGGTPSAVIRAGVDGFARGLRSRGVAATAKHFPGFGAARVNTDDASQRIRLSRKELRRVDERPFGAFSDAGGELVMLSLASYRAFGDRPAALDRSIATRELRGRVGFRGVSVSDSLDAAAALEFGSRRRVALAAAAAGTDVLLYGDWRTAARTNRTLRRALSRGKLSRRGFERSAQRVVSLRSKLGG